MVKAKNIVVGITGTMTSGKGALQYFLIDRGFKSLRLTQAILDHGLKSKLNMRDRKNWIDIVVDLRKKHGMDILSEKVDEKMSENERYVICPIRHPADIKYLKKKYNALILFVDAPFELRYKRTFLKELGSPLSKEEFKKKDDKENKPSGKDKKYLPNISECRRLSDVEIMNDKTLNDLNTRLEKTLRQHKIPDLIDTDSYDDFDV